MTATALTPGPGPAPLNMLGWVSRPIPFMERCRRRYGDRFSVNLGPRARVPGAAPLRQPALRT